MTQPSKTDEYAKEVLRMVHNSKELASKQDFHSLFLDVEGIISTLAFLAGPRVEREHAYRLLVVQFIDQGKSKAEAEARGKASQEYVAWQKLEYVCKLADEQIKILKKFKDDLQQEWDRS